MLNFAATSGSKPTWVQQNISPVVTYIFYHLLRLPSRNALAGSLKSGLKAPGILFGPQQKAVLLRLLKEHKMIQPKFAALAPEAVEAYHFCKLTSKARIALFIDGFNTEFSGQFRIAFVAGQFSLLKAKSVAEQTSGLVAMRAQPVQSESLPARDHLLTLLQDANRPLTLAQIIAELAVVPPGNLEIAKALGKLSAGSDYISEEEAASGSDMASHPIMETYAEDPQNIRYLHRSQFPRFLHQSVATIALSSDTRRLVHIEEAERMVQSGKARKFMESNGHFYYLAETHYQAILSTGGTMEVQTAGLSFRIFAADLPALLQQGLIVRGITDGSFNPCYLAVDNKTQKAKAHLIFNALLVPYLRRAKLDFDQEYVRLRAAFDAGLQACKEESTLPFLYEAQVAVSLGAGREAVALALLKTPKAAAALPPRIFTAEEIKNYTAAARRLIFMLRFPLIFFPLLSHSLQNYIDLIYDLTDSYPVFLLLIIGKAKSLREVAQHSQSLPASLRREVKMVYAPLAEKHGFIDLARNMRDLVVKLDDPDRYQAVREKMEAKIEMDFDQARIYLAWLAQTIRESLPTELQGTIEISTRVKDVASFMEKEDTAIKKALDILGIRFICRHLDAARQVCAILEEKISFASDTSLPPGKSIIADHLETPNANGWRGWRGHFKPFDHTVSLQVMTAEMEAEDRIGKAAHWFYKARRAAGSQQIFVPAPLAGYSGDPEHDYYIDRNHARQYKRVLVIPPYDLKTKKPQNCFAEGELLIMRFPKEATMLDLLCHRVFRGAPFYNFQQIMFFELISDDLAGAIVPRWRARTVGMGYTPANGTLLAPYPGATADKPNRSVAARLKPFAHTPRARLVIETFLSSKTPEALVEEGEAIIGNALNTPAKCEQAQVVFELADIKEVKRAVALGILSKREVEAALGILKTEVLLTPINGSREDVKLSIFGPASPGILKAILRSISQYLLLGGHFEIDTRAHGASPLQAVFALRPTGRPAKEVNLNAIYACVDKPDLVEPPSINNPAQMQVSFPASKKEHWKIIHAIAELAKDNAWNILEVELPDTSKQQLPTGWAVIEYDTDLHKGIESIKTQFVNAGLTQARITLIS